MTHEHPPAASTPGAREDLGAGITCLDADYVAPGTACFYLLESAGEYAVVETGTSRSLDNLEVLLEERAIDPDRIRYVIPTHVHLDHAGGAGAMMAAFAGAQLLVHPRGARHMIDPAWLVDAAKAVYGEELFGALYGEVLPVPASRVREMADGDTVELGGRALEFRHTEGHARHHLCVWDERSRGWFCGDMFGVCYRGLRLPAGDFLLPSTTPTQFDPDAYAGSLALLESYAPQRLYLTHFGALAFSAAKRRLLAEQVETYRDLALGAGDDAAALEELLMRDALQRLRAFDPALDETAMRDLLRFDMQLNAQGLVHWREQLSGAR